MSATTAPIVVVGAGIGGLRVVEGLRRLGVTAPITLIGAETHPPYDRPPLTKEVLRSERDSTALREELDSLDTQTRFGCAVSGLDADARSITLEDGSTIDYADLVIATGATPRTLRGMSSPTGVTTFRTLEDALSLRSDLDGVREPIAVIGGGFLGCEVAASLRSRGHEVHIVELAAAPLALALGDQGGELARCLHHAHGVHLHLGSAVSRILGDPTVSGVELDNGEIIAAGRVVLGIGVDPAVGWLAGSGLMIDDGIVCDSAGRTSVPNVYALGDVARWFSPTLGRHQRVEHWTRAGEQAATVATVLAGDTDIELDTQPYVWSEQYDVIIQSVGFVDPSDEVTLVEVDRDNGRTVLLYTRDGSLRAAVGFGAPRHIMRLRAKVGRGTSLDQAQEVLAR